MYHTEASSRLELRGGGGRTKHSGVMLEKNNGQGVAGIASIKKESAGAEVTEACRTVNMMCLLSLTPAG